MYILVKWHETSEIFHREQELAEVTFSCKEQIHLSDELILDTHTHSHAFTAEPE